MRPKDAPHAPTDTRTALVGLSRAELAAELASLGEKAFRTKQVWHWLYHRGAKTFAEMTDLGKELRAKLDERYIVGRPTVAREQTSTDRTRKWLMAFGDGQKAETVFIPEDDRGAVCISSQVGCTLTCRTKGPPSSACGARHHRSAHTFDGGADRRQSQGLTSPSLASADGR